MTSSATTLLRARVPAGVPRADLQRWLADLDPQRQGLPPQAIVVLRRLSARLTALAPDADNAADPFAAALRQAVRPAREHFVGAGVGAVWFADEAELLVCLARDALAGALGRTWWWALLLGQSPALPQAQTRWVAGARAVPQALALLQADGLGEAWLVHIGPAGRAELLRGLAQAWPLCSAVRRWVEDGLPARRQDPLATQATAASEGGITSVQHGGGQTQVGDGASERLLRLAALLRQAPHRAADAGLLGELWVTQSGSAGLGEAGLAPSAAGASAGLRRAAKLRLGRESSGSGGAGAVLVTRWQPGTHGAAVVAAAAEPPPSPALPGPPRPVAAPTPAALEHAFVAAPQPLQPEGAAAPARASRPAAATAADAAAHFHTRCGGLAFLFNVALALGLYGDFTQPQHRGQPLSPWWLLDEAGHAIWGRAWAADPLAAWLRRRAGPPAPDPVPLPWQLPPAALQAFAADARPWHAVQAPQSVLLRHPANFVVAWLTGPSELSGMLQTLPQPGQGVRVHTTPRPARQQRLASLLWPLLRARLALGLGLRARAALHCLALPAQVQAGAGRLDLHFSLAALPLGVRLAGLDRDPGWVPAAGCDIRFHFD